MPSDSPPGSLDDDAADSFLREAAAVSEPQSVDLAASAPLHARHVLADRFRIERRAGRGGMGAVYKAEDTVAGGHVAIKVVARQSGSSRERFLREAVVLAELSHPCIVRYVAHGTTPVGLPFLAMDWLEGEDLSERVARLPLSIDESLAIVRRA